MALPISEAEPTTSREGGLEEPFALHGRAVYAFARRRASAADADEVLSETFLVAWRRFDTFQKSRCRGCWASRGCA